MKTHNLSVKRKEIVGIDVMKAFFAICVVAIHTYPYAVYTSMPYSIMRFLDTILLCSVPFFFITTGYFVGKRLTYAFFDEKNTDILKYYLVKYLKLYLIWTAVYFPITLYYYIVISNQSIWQKFLYFFRGFVFIGEQWYSWMLWYILSIISITAICAATVNIILNFILIPRFGAYGAAIATVVAFSFQWILRFWVVKKTIKLKNSTIIEVATYFLLLLQMILAYWGNKFIAIEIMIFITIFIIYARLLLPFAKTAVKNLRNKGT